MRAIVLSIIAAGALWALTHPASAANVKDVLDACDRTEGCKYSQSKNGDITGCSLQSGVCFYCPADGSRECTGGNKARTAGKGASKGPLDIGGVKLDRASKSSKAAKAIREHERATSNQTIKTAEPNKSHNMNRSHKTDTTMKSDNSKKSTSGHSNDMKKIDHASSAHQQMQHSGGSNRKH